MAQVRQLAGEAVRWPELRSRELAQQVVPPLAVLLREKECPLLRSLTGAGESCSGLVFWSLSGGRLRGNSILARRNLLKPNKGRSVGNLRCCDRLHLWRDEAFGQLTQLDGIYP